MCNDPNRWHCAGCKGCGNVHFPDCPYVKKSPDSLASIAESLERLADIAELELRDKWTSSTDTKTIKEIIAKYPRITITEGEGK